MQAAALLTSCVSVCPPQSLPCQTELVRVPHGEPDVDSKLLYCLPGQLLGEPFSVVTATEASSSAARPPLIWRQVSPVVYLYARHHRKVSLVWVDALLNEVLQVLRQQQQQQ